MNVGQAPRRLTINITQEDIDSGLARDSNKCIVADAIRRQHPHFQRVSVDLATIRISDLKRKTRSLYFTPPVFQRIIIDTDQGNKKRIKPCTSRLVAGQVVPIIKRSSKEKASRRQYYHQIVKPKTLISAGNGTTKGEVPVVSGGKFPPIAPGSRRTYGLRGLYM